jgi:hypothetical protein
MRCEMSLTLRKLWMMIMKIWSGVIHHFAFLGLCGKIKSSIYSKIVLASGKCRNNLLKIKINGKRNSQKNLVKITHVIY